MADKENEIVDAEIISETKKPDALQQGARGNMELAIAGALEWTPETLQKQIEQEKQMRGIIVQYTKDAMIEGHHFYKITKGGKPAVSKEGAYNLRSLFKVTPGPREITKEWHDDGHLTVTARSPLYDRAGNLVATGDGLATTRESKWAYRSAERVCPNCGVGAIIKGKKEYGGGWLCYKNKGGCGSKYEDNDKAITGQEIGKVDNENLADLYNTCLKIAGKRADVDAALQLPLVSELFTQDVDESHIAAAVGIKPNDRQENKQSKPPAETKGKKDWFGSGPAAEVKDELAELCKNLNAQNDEFEGSKWSPVTLHNFCIEEFEANLADMTGKQVVELRGKLAMRLSALVSGADEADEKSTEHFSKKPEKAVESDEDESEETGDVADANQIKALHALADIKDLTEEQISNQFSDDRTDLFGELTKAEAEKAIKELNKASKAKK